MLVEAVDFRRQKRLTRQSDSPVLVAYDVLEIDAQDYGASLYKSAESAWRGFYEAQGHGNAEVALYLASRASGLVCGAVIPVDGGLATTA